MENENGWESPRAHVLPALYVLVLPRGSSWVVPRKNFLFVFILGQFLDLDLSLRWMEAHFKMLNYCTE